MKIDHFIFLLILGFLLFNCTRHKENNFQVSIDQIERISIPLDDNQGKPDLTRNFYFIFDGSGSMREFCANQVKLQGAKQAVKKFLEKVPADVNLGLYIFDDRGEREVLSLGSGHRDQFLSAINQVEASGGTPLAEAMRFGTDRLVAQYKRQLGYGEYRLIIVTDGIASDIQNASIYTIQYGIPIYAIGLCMEGNHPLRQYAMSYRAANNYEDLERALEETVAESEQFDPTDFQE